MREEHKFVFYQGTFLSTERILVYSFNHHKSGWNTFTPDLWNSCHSKVRQHLLSNENLILSSSVNLKRTACNLWHSGSLNQNKSKDVSSHTETCETWSHAEAGKFMFEVMFLKFYSRNVSLRTRNWMKETLRDFSAYEHCGKHLGSCKYTNQQNI